MRVNEDFLDDSKIEDVEQRDATVYEKSIEQFKWLLHIFIYVENDLKQIERIINKIENEIRRLADRCAAITDYSVTIYDNQLNKLNFDLYFDNNFKTLESFFRFIHPLTNMLWNNLNSIGNSDDDGHIDYILYKYDNGDFRTYVGGEEFYDMCDEQLLRSSTADINDIYRVAIKMFNKPQTYPTLIKHCSPNDYIVKLILSSSERFKKVNELINNYNVRCNCANKHDKYYGFLGSKFEKEISEIHFNDITDSLIDDKNLFLYEMDAKMKPVANKATEEIRNYVINDLNGLNNFSADKFGYLFSGDNKKFALYFYIGCPYIETNRHIVLEIDLDLNNREDAEEKWEHYFQEPLPSAL